MKKITIVVFSLLLLLSSLCGEFVVSKAEKTSTTRVINVVYDDSGSTYYDNAQTKMDIWSNSLYAIEALSALLQNDDTMNVFQMSSNEYKDSNPSKLTIKGSDSMKKRIDMIDTIQIDYCNTPYRTVENAYNDLTSRINSTADELWLVVITDGIFQEDDKTLKPKVVKDLKKRLEQLESQNAKVNVVLLTIGNKVDDGLNSKKYNYFHAKNSGQIVDKVAEISNLIFERRTVPSNMKTKNSVTIDVPMKSLVVFAQGSVTDVSNTQLKKTSGEVVNCNVDAIDANYINENGWKDSDAYKGNIYLPESVAEDLRNKGSNLSGYIATFEPKDGVQIDAGTYEFEMAGSTDFEVYYEPNLEVGYKIYDEEGNDVTNEKQLQTNHTYTYEVGFVNPDDLNQIIKPNDSDLIDDKDLVSKIVVQNNGETVECKDNTFILKEKGNSSITITGNYFGFYPIDIKKEYELVSKILTVQQDTQEKPFDSENLSGSTISFVPKIDGEPLTNEQWENLQAAISTDSNIVLTLSKDIQKQKIVVEVAQDDNENTKVVRENIPYQLSLMLEDDGELLEAGIEKGMIAIEDGRPWIIIWGPWIALLLILLYILIVFISKVKGPTGIFKRLYTDVSFKSSHPRKLASCTGDLSSQSLCEICCPFYEWLLPISIKRRCFVNHYNVDANVPDLIVRSNKKQLEVLNPQKDFDDVLVTSSLAEGVSDIDFAHKQKINVGTSKDYIFNKYVNGKVRLTFTVEFFYE